MRAAQTDSAALSRALLALLVLAGCRSVPERGAADHDAPAGGAAAEPAMLAASETTVSGVVLPVGLDHAYDVEDASVFRTDTRVDRVFQFFLARHPGVQVDRAGEGGVLRRVPIRLGPRGETRHVDVSVLGRSNGGARVQITLLAKADADPPAGEALAEQARHLD